MPSRTKESADTSRAPDLPDLRFHITPLTAPALIDALRASFDAAIETELLDHQGSVLVLSIDQGCGFGLGSPQSDMYFDVDDRELFE